MQAQSSANTTRLDWSHIDPAWGNWFAGFVDGEGSFLIYRQSMHRGSYSCRFSLEIRCDDQPILEEIQQTLGLGFLRQRATVAKVVNAKPVAYWRIYSQADCLSLVRFFDRFPLRAKKARDYAVWREAVLFLAQYGPRGGKRNIDWSRMAELKDALVEGRRYQGVVVTPTIPASRPVQYELLEND